MAYGSSPLKIALRRRRKLGHNGTEEPFLFLCPIGGDWRLTKGKRQVSQSTVPSEPIKDPFLPCQTEKEGTDSHASSNPVLYTPLKVAKSSQSELTVSLTTGVGQKVSARLREFCRQAQAEVVSKSRIKIH